VDARGGKKGIIGNEPGYTSEIQRGKTQVTRVKFSRALGTFIS